MYLFFDVVIVRVLSIFHKLRREKKIVCDRIIVGEFSFSPFLRRFAIWHTYILWVRFMCVLDIEHGWPHDHIGYYKLYMQMAAIDAEKKIEIYPWQEDRA